MSEEHSERSEGIIKVAVLIVGTVVLIGTGFIAGRATAPKGSAVEAAREGGSVAKVASATNEAGKVAAGGSAPAGGTAGGGAAGGEGAAANPNGGYQMYKAPGSKVGRRADALTERATYDYSDKAGDKVGEHVNEGTTEVAEKVGSSLPGPLKFLAPFIRNSAGYYAGSAVKEGVADKINDTATEGIKSGKERASGKGEGEGGAREGGSGGESRTASAGGEGGGGGASGAAAAPAPRWAVELGRFATSDNANSYAADMNRQGVGTRIAMQQDSATGQTWYAVRTGTYAGPGAAREALDRLGGEGFHGTVVSEAATGGVR